MLHGIGKIRLPPVSRRAGESLREKRDNLVGDYGLLIVGLPALCWFVYAIEQVHQASQAAPEAKIWFSLAIVCTGIAVIAFWRLMAFVRRINRGERGELHVADVLEKLRADGYTPIHDIVGKNFNVDHVLVGPGGVFAIETKFRSGKGEIIFRDGEGLFVGGRVEEKDCLKQARGNAATISRLIQHNCGKQVWVWPLLVFVGDWRVKDDWCNTDARVFTPDRLTRYIRDQQPRLKRSEIELIASQLERCADQEHIWRTANHQTRKSRLIASTVEGRGQRAEIRS